LILDLTDFFKVCLSVLFKPFSGFLEVTELTLAVFMIDFNSLFVNLFGTWGRLIKLASSLFSVLVSADLVGFICFNKFTFKSSFFLIFNCIIRNIN
jgi:hypothetical protein